MCRSTTPEADGMEEEAQEEEHEDTNASHQNRNKISSERGSSPAEIKANLSERRNSALNGTSERRRSGPQAPIVWDPSVLRPKSLFDHHQRLLDVPAPTHSEKQDFGVSADVCAVEFLQPSHTCEYDVYFALNMSRKTHEFTQARSQCVLHSNFRSACRW